MKGMPERIAKYHAVILDFWNAKRLKPSKRNPDMSPSTFRKLLLGDRRRISTTCLTESNGSRRRNSASVDQHQRQLLESSRHSRYQIAIVIVLCFSHISWDALESEVICFRRRYTDDCKCLFLRLSVYRCCSNSFVKTGS